MKKAFKRWLSVFLCLVMVFSLSFANIAEDFNVENINNNEVVLDENALKNSVNEELGADKNDDSEEIVEEENNDAEEELTEEELAEENSDECKEPAEEEQVEEESVEEEQVEEEPVEEEPAEEEQTEEEETVNEDKLEEEEPIEKDNSEDIINEDVPDEENISKNTVDGEKTDEEEKSVENTDNIEENVSDTTNIDNIENDIEDKNQINSDQIEDNKNGVDEEVSSDENKNATPSDADEILSDLVAIASDSCVVMEEENIASVSCTVMEEENIASDSCTDKMLFGVTTPVYWYLTDGNTKLHIAGTQPVAPEYADDSEHNSYSNSKMSSYKADITDIIFDDPVTTNTCSQWFDGFTNLVNVQGITNLTLTGTSVTIYEMFKDCTALTTLDLSGLNTNEVKNMSYMFDGCTQLATLNVNGLDTSSVTNMSYMFRNCTSLATVNLSSFVTNSVTNMSYMFENCESITDLNLSNFVTTSATSMTSMFEGCTNLTTLDISNFTVPSTNRSNMINKCPSLTTLKLSLSAAVASSKWHIEYDWKKQGGTTIYKYVNGTYPTNTTNNKTTLPSEAGTYVRVTNSSNRIAITYNISGTSSYYYSQTVDKGEKIKKPSTPSKTGYTFLNWFKESTYENAFNFDIAPTTSMTIYAKWFDNNTTDYVLKSSWYNNCTFDKSFVTKITFQKGGAAPSGTNFIWDGSNGLSAYLNGTEIVIYAPDSTKNIYLLSTSNSTNSLFYGFSKLKEIVNLDVLDVSNCTTFYYMFYGCYALQNIDLSNFNTTNVVNMQSMFGWCLSLNDINLSTFDTRNVSNMQSMFNNCSSLEILDVGNFNTTNVVDMSSMFASCKTLRSLDLSNFNTMNVTNMSNMFNNCQALTSIDVSSFNTLNVTNISHMFSQCRKLLKLDIRSFNTSNVTDMRNAFSYNRLLHTIYASNNFITTKANKKSSNMFYGSVSLIGSAGTTYDKSKRDCTYARIDSASVPGYFSAYNSNTAVFNLDKGINNYNVTSVKVSRKAKGTTVTVPVSPFTRGEYIFKGWVDQNGNAVAVGSTITLNDDVTLTAKWKTNDLYIRNNWLDESIIKRTKVTKITFQNGGSASGTMFNVGENETIKGYVEGTEVTIIIPSGKTLYLGDGSVFYNFTVLEEIEGLNLLNTSKTIDMSLLFYFCTYLESVDLSNFDTRKVIDMQSMFSNCLSLTTLDVSSFDTSNVHYEGGDYCYGGSMYGMFSDCKKLTNIIGLSGFDTKNVNDMGRMFAGCESLTNLDLSNFDTSHCVDSVDYGSETFYAMFDGCKSLTTLNVSSFETSGATDMARMFAGCESLTSLNVSNFDTSNVMDMGSMFDGCKSLTTIDISNFNTSSVTDMYGMFGDDIALTTIYADKFDTSKATSYYSMFYNCTSLVGGNGTAYTTDHMDGDYARIDKAATPGYFTYRASTQNTYSVVFSPNGASGTMKTVKKAKGTSYKIPDCTYTYPGYAFMYWANVDGKTYKPGSTVKLNKSYSLMAVWQSADEVTYTITFRPNGGSGSQFEESYQAGAKVILPPNEFYNEGYYFLNWKSTKGKSYEDRATFTITSDMILDAQWRSKGGGSSSGGSSGGGGGGGVISSIKVDGGIKSAVESQMSAKSTEPRKDTVIFSNQCAWNYDLVTGGWSLTTYAGNQRTQATKGFYNLIRIDNSTGEVINAVYHFDENGQMTTGWVRDTNGALYYFEPEKTVNEGLMCLGWKSIDGLWYYFGEDGKMLTNQLTPDGYEVNADGSYKI